MNTSEPSRRRPRATARRALLTVLVAALAITAPTPPASGAGPEGFSVQHFLVKPGADRIFSVEGSEVAPAWTPYGGLWFHYVDAPLRLVVAWPGEPEQREALVERMMLLQVGVGLGLFDLAELEVVAPVTFGGAGNTNVFPGVADAGLGDLLVRLRFRLLGRDALTLDGFGLNLGVTLGLPTGSKEATTGDGGVTVRPILAATVGVGPVLLALNVGVNLRTEAEDFVNLRLGHELLYGFGLQVAPHELLALGLELVGRTRLESPFDQTSESPMELVGGVKLQPIPGLRFELGAGAGLASGYGAPSWRLFTGLQWAPQGGVDPDSDGDGIPDSLDACPHDPEDFDGFEDEDGCPEPDNDGDGICDPWVAEAGLLERYAHICKGVDRCPNEPEDFDGFEDEDGCPEPDNDGDGIPDIRDRCRDVPEDFDGFEDEDGCPDLDNDDDGIFDVADLCPFEPETFNDYQDEDGCPDTPPPARVEDCQIVISDTVHFRTARAAIEEKSYGLLDEVAATIESLAAYDYVLVEGHTDDRGTVSYNRQLSDARARAVRAYLIKQGIPARKLRHRGFGPDRPIADNSTPEGMAKNRRVEFRIVGGECP